MVSATKYAFYHYLLTSAGSLIYDMTPLIDQFRKLFVFQNELGEKGGKSSFRRIHIKIINCKYK